MAKETWKDLYPDTESKYLKVADIGVGAIVEITSADIVEVQFGNSAAQRKIVWALKGSDGQAYKPLVLSKTNARRCATELGIDPLMVQGKFVHLIPYAGRVNGESRTYIYVNGFVK